MKRLAIILCILITLGMTASGLPGLAWPSRVPHENPATATGSPDKLALLLSCGRIFSLATSRQYQDARDLLNELQRTDFPGELRLIVDRYINCSRQLVTNLDNLESLLDEDSTLLSHNQTHEASQKLNDAGTSIQNAHSQQKDIRAATDALSDQLGILASPAASPLRLACGELEGSLERLTPFITEFERRQQSLTERYIQTASFIPTELSLDITPASAFVGDSITASGKLSGDGQRLAGKDLTIFLDNTPVDVTTGTDGTYFTSINIPYNYVTAMTLTAAYQPSGEDTGMYLASQSPPVTVKTSFYHTLVEVSAPESASPGLPFDISGRVISDDPGARRTVRILLDDIPLAEETAAGRFHLKVSPTETVKDGKHSLSVTVPPQGRYTGATETRILSISRLPVYLDAQTPKLYILLDKIQIGGKVYQGFGPVPGAGVSLDFKGSSNSALTSADGSFVTSLEAPLDLSLASLQELTMTVTPLEPWYTPFRVKKLLLTINPLSTSLVLFIMIVLSLLIFIRSQTRLPAEKAIPQPVTLEPPTIPAPGLKSRLTGIKGRILSAYRGSLETVEKTIGVGMAPNITLREFLKITTLLLPMAIRQFAELTTIAEVALYSARNLREDSATRAERLAATIKEELHRGSP